MGNKGESIAFFSTYRPPVPLDIFSCEAGGSNEAPLTDRKSYNYNGQVIPEAALSPILAQMTKSGSNGHTGMAFISERDNGLELIQFAIYKEDRLVSIKSLGEVYDSTNAHAVRMEDSPCFAGDNIIYISTVQPALERRQPWTAVYKTDLNNGITQRLTPTDVADLSPSVSPSGKKIAVASFEGKGGWEGEIKDLETDIFVMDINNPSDRILVVSNGGWPSWGSEDIVFFHRRSKKEKKWGVYRADISVAIKTGKPVSDDNVTRVTPDDMDAMTPAAIGPEAVAVAIIRKKSTIANAQQGRGVTEYRHIEIFDIAASRKTVVTQTVCPKADHFNPFVIDAQRRVIGYHRCRITDHLMRGGLIEKKLEDVKSPHEEVNVLRMPGVFPTFTRDGKKLAFVDNEFKAVWVADETGLRIAYNAPDEDSVFSTVWCQSENSDTLYICMGPSFKSSKELHIHAIPHVSRRKKNQNPLTEGDSNNAFPSTNKDGTLIVFRSTRDGRKGDKRFKSLYIMDSSGGNVQRLTTKEKCTDTHCQWSPTGDWIVFASDRDKPSTAPPSDNDLDPGYFSVFLVNYKNKDVIVRVMQSGSDIAGHVNHPVFSPDGTRIVVTSDLAAVTVDPISMPLVTHSVRPYGDIFTFKIDPININKNKNIKDFVRVTHSRYENSTATWTTFNPNATSLKLDFTGRYAPACPYMHSDGGQSWHMSGHLCIPKSCC